MSELLNLVGLSTGIVLYAMLLAMVIRAGRTPGGPGRVDLLLIATAVLGLLWNLCALPAYELPKLGIEGPFTFLIAAGFSALGFLPAVVVQSVLRGEADRVAGKPKRAADIFLKRALTLLVLVTAALVSVTFLHASSAGAPLGSAREVGSLVLLWVGTALLYPRLRDAIAWFVDTIVLNRPDYDQLRAAIGWAAQRHDDVAPLLDEACGQLAPALSARIVAWHEVAVARPTFGPAAAVVEIPVTEPPSYVLEVAGLLGGRRLLSDDHAALDAIASMLGRRIDAIRLTHERFERELREQEVAKLATEAELRALRSQINPHFLFNALTTIGYLIQSAPARALDTLMRLTSLRRGVLRSEGEFTTLERELEVIESYLDIERARL